MKALLLTLLLASGSLLAQHESGKETGNGGFVYKCGYKLELMDLMEVRYIPNLSVMLDIPEDNRPYEHQLAEKLRILNSFNVELANNIEKRIRFIESHLSFRSKLDEIDPRDLGPYIDVQNCTLENVIKYTKEPFARADLYKRLSSRDKAALLLHEALYAEARKVDEVYHDLESSLPIRRVVAILFSEDPYLYTTTLKEIIRFYLVPFGREIGREVRLKVCLDKKYLNLRKDLVALDDEFIEDLQIIVRQYHSPEDPARMFGKQSESSDGDSLTVKQKISLSGESFIRRPTRCDGSEGESYVAITKPMVQNYPNQFTATWDPGSKMFSFGDKKLDGTLYLTLLEQKVAFEKLEGSHLSANKGEKVFDFGIIDTPRIMGFTVLTKMFFRMD